MQYINLYDNYRWALIRMLGASNEGKADKLFEEIFSSKRQTHDGLQSLYK
jgi:hypothetical protein